jgi:predicted membrane-bound mannosyltransferase
MKMCSSVTATDVITPLAYSFSLHPLLTYFSRFFKNDVLDVEKG